MAPPLGGTGYRIRFMGCSNIPYFLMIIFSNGINVYFINGVQSDLYSTLSVVDGNLEVIISSEIGEDQTVTYVMVMDKPE